MVGLRQRMFTCVMLCTGMTEDYRRADFMGNGDTVAEGYFDDQLDQDEKPDEI